MLLVLSRFITKGMYLSIISVCAEFKSDSFVSTRVPTDIEVAMTEQFVAV